MSFLSPLTLNAMNHLSPTTSLSASVVEVHDLLSDKYDFEIPFYQRAYAWEEKQAEELVGDLLEASHGRGMFLGNLVLAKLKGDRANRDDGAEHCNAIVDGQQRITTLTILCAVLRHLVEDEKLSGNIGQLLLSEGNQLRGTQPRPRLKPWGKHATFFKAYVQEADSLEDLFEKTPDNEFQDRVKKNTQKIHSLLEGKSQDELTLLAKTLSKSRVVVTQTDNEYEAFQIFQTLNSRGMPLTFVDIIKAEIIGNLPEHMQEGLLAQWDRAMETVGEDNEEAIFTHLTSWRRKTTSQRSDINAKDDFFKHWQMARTDPSTFIETVLKRTAGWFDWLTGNSLPPKHLILSAQGQAISEQIRAINQTSSNFWIPAAFAFLETNPTPENLLKFLRAAEKLTHFGLITKGNGAETRWYDVIRAIEAGEKLFDGDNEHPCLTLSPTQQTLFYQALNGDLYGTLGTRKTVIIVRRLDQLLDSQSKTHHDKLTVEHVLPQKPRSGGVFSQAFPEDQHARWVNRLANLILISKKKNCEASNSEFIAKKNAYLGVKVEGGRCSNGISATPLTVKALSENEWTPAVLEKLQNEHIAVLEKHWKLWERDKSAAEATPAAPRKRRQRWSHALLGIPDGAQLVLNHAGQNISGTATAVGKDRVHFQGQPMSLTEASIRAGVNGVSRANSFWFYNGKSLASLYEEALSEKSN